MEEEHNITADLLGHNDSLLWEDEEERRLQNEINSSFGAWLVFMEMSLALIGKNTYSEDVCRCI